jgi:hypothetical protein
MTNGKKLSVLDTLRKFMPHLLVGCLRHATTYRCPQNASLILYGRVENAKFLRERISDPLGPESCADTARDSVKRRQGYRRGGQLSCENIQPGRRRG